MTKTIFFDLIVAFKKSLIYYCYKSNKFDINNKSKIFDLNRIKELGENEFCENLFGEKR